jgi:hypothetical protein
MFTRQQAYLRNILTFAFSETVRESRSNISLHLLQQCCETRMFIRIPDPDFFFILDLGGEVIRCITFFEASNFTKFRK